jgi:hypothetical protein
MSYTPLKFRAAQKRQKFEVEKQRVLAKLRMLNLFGDTSDDATRARIERCRGKENLIEFGRTYLPHYFSSSDQAEWHDEYIETFDKAEEVFSIVAPRGMAKSTIGSFADVLHDIVYQTEPFIVLAMETQEKAAMQVWRILLELQFNELLLHDFGRLVSAEAAYDDFTTIPTPSHPVRTRLAALGGGQSARGLVNAQYRPTKFICDDIESRRVARSPKMVEKFVDIILSDWLYSLAPTGWKFRIVGTMICRGSVLDTLRKNDEFKHLHFRAIENFGTPQERSTWESYQPLALLRKMFRIERSKFMAEKQGEPIETEGLIKDEWIVSWGNLPDDLERHKRELWIDPSFEKTGDTCAGWVITPYVNKTGKSGFMQWRKQDGEPFGEGQYDIIENVFCRKMSTTEFFELLYDFNRRYKPRYINIEGVFAQKTYFRNEYRRYQMDDRYGPLPIKFFTPQNKPKEQRIRELEVPIEQGEIVFPPRSSGNPDLESALLQLTRFGEPGVNDDAPDALATARFRIHKKERKTRKIGIG